MWPGLAFHVKDIGEGVFVRSQDPEDLSRGVQQFVGMGLRVGEVSKDANVCRAGRRAGRGGTFTLFEFGVKAEVTLVDGSDLFIKVPGVIRTGGHTGLASDTLFDVHGDDAGGLVLVGGAGGTDPDTGWIVAVVTEDGHKVTLPGTRWSGEAAFQDSGTVSMFGDVVGGAAGLETSLAVDTVFLSDNHSVVGAIRETLREYFGATQCRLAVFGRGQGQDRTAEKDPGDGQSELEEVTPLGGGDGFQSLIIQCFKIFNLHTLSFFYLHSILFSMLFSIQVYRDTCHNLA